MGRRPDLDCGWECPGSQVTFINLGFEVLQRNLLSRSWSLHSPTPSVSFGRMGQVKQPHLSPGSGTPDPPWMFILCCAGTTMATAGAPIGAGARCWGVASSFLGCSVLAGGEKSHIKPCCLKPKPGVIKLLQLILPIVRPVNGQPGQQQRNHLRGK